MNQMKNRMQALGLLDRSVRATPDDELTAAVEALDADHREALEELVDETDPDGVRAAVRAGRIDGRMEAIVGVLTDACLADCVEQLGDHADNPSSDQLREVLPGLVERHGLGVTRMMLAATVAGEASAAAIIRDLLKSDELVALPKADDVRIAPTVTAPKRSDDEQAELRERRKEARRAKREEARARREQSAAARRR